MDGPEEHQVMEFVMRSNIERFKKLLRRTTDEGLRRTVAALLVREEARLVEIQPARQEVASVRDRFELS